MSSNLFAISFFVSNFALFLFSVQTAKRKCDLEKPHKYRIYNKNTIGVQPLGVQIPMVFSKIFSAFRRWELNSRARKKLVATATAMIGVGDLRSRHNRTVSRACLLAKEEEQSELCSGVAKDSNFDTMSPLEVRGCIVGEGVQSKCAGLYF